MKPVPGDNVPSGGNLINSHTLYKVKSNDNGSFKLKARIVPHGNEEPYVSSCRQTVPLVHLLDSDW